MVRDIIRILKKIPVDFGQYEVRYTTKGKLIAFSLVGDGRGLRALDLGCRDGYWSGKLKSLGYVVVGGDVSPQCADGIYLDANQPLPFPDAHFDLVWCSEVIEHLRDPRFTVGEIKRVLGPEGRLLLTTPNLGFWFYRLADGLRIGSAKIQSEDHLHFFTYADIRNLLETDETYGFFPYLWWKSTVRGRAASILSPTIVACSRGRQSFSGRRPGAS